MHRSRLVQQLATHCCCHQKTTKKTADQGCSRRRQSRTTNTTHDNKPTTDDQKPGRRLCREADHVWVKERIMFLLSRLPPKVTTNAQNGTNVDWPKAFLRDGCGAGLTTRQAVLAAIQALLHPPSDPSDRCKDHDVDKDRSDRDRAGKVYSSDVCPSDDNQAIDDQRPI